MKISDIPMLTGEGHYSVNIPLGHLKDNLDRYEKTYGLVPCPDFQRGHVWSIDQQIAFVEFILRGGKTSAIQFNHPGWMGSFKGEFVCVDGLQRLTALLKFINNDLAVFNGKFLKDFDDPDHLLRKYDIVFRVNNLKSRKEVLKWYLEMNSGGTPHTEAEILKVEELLKKEEQR